MVNAASEDKLDQILAFIEYMSASEQQRAFALQSARLPTLKGLYEDEEVLERLPVARLGGRRSRTPVPGPSHHTTRTCRSPWRSSSTPPSRARSSSSGP